jgi:hypothetical protein
MNRECVGEQHNSNNKSYDIYVKRDKENPADCLVYSYNSEFHQTSKPYLTKICRLKS